MRSSGALVVLGVTVAAGFAAENYLPDDKLVTQVEKRVHDLQPREERKPDLVGWAPDVLAAEKLAHAEVRRIYVDFLNRKLGVGNVRLYILKPDGASLAGLDPDSAMNPEKLEPFLTGMQLLPRQAPREGDSWQVAPALTRKLLTRFYPQTEEPPMPTATA